MPLGSMNHIALTVTDRVKSDPFYQVVLQFMGYKQIEQTDEYTMWWSESTGGAILTTPAHPDCLNKVHDRYSPGLHHLAFAADRREQVDQLYKLLLDIGATILDSPAEYNHYAPGYYAVFFADPDGIKLEFVHMPVIP